MNPQAKSNLLWEEMEEETLVYDLDRHRVHSLNPAAAFLLREANGDRTPADLTALARETLAEPTSEEVTHLGLDRLFRAHLVAWDPPESPGNPQTRREVVRKLALLGMALPSVMTVVTPMPAQAATLVTNRGCRDDGPANVGNCCTNGRTCILADPVRNRYRCQGPSC